MKARATLSRVRGEVRAESWPLREPFHIKGYVFPSAEVVTVTLTDGVHVGRGEAAGVYYRGETPETLVAQIEQALASAADLSRAGLYASLPAGGARNALDCALWDLEAQQVGAPVWRLAGLEPPRPLRTTFTLGVEGVAATAERAAATGVATALKLKLAGDGLDADRVRAVRAARPDAWLSVDANQALDLPALLGMADALQACGVAMVEQPLPVGDELLLKYLGFPIPLAADESVQSSDDLTGLLGCFQIINIKLDKCGGLTEGLAMAHRARRLGFEVMVGNMTCTSLGLAPGFVLGQVCDIADLDGPTFLEADRPEAARYTAGEVICDPAVWGGGGT